ncbi:MAG TPA: hypothetical protein P5250_00880 [Bacteroidales bacterium]|nr:hypothetical protein [Bacteroidales bacterium]
MSLTAIKDIEILLHMQIRDDSEPNLTKVNYLIEQEETILKNSFLSKGLEIDLNNEIEKSLFIDIVRYIVASIILFSYGKNFDNVNAGLAEKYKNISKEKFDELLRLKINKNIYFKAGGDAVWKNEIDEIDRRFK